MKSDYKADLKTIVKQYKLFVRNDLSGKVPLVLADPSHNAKRARNDAHTDHEVFDLNNTKDVA